ncbi:unnamed protein product [Allacma fusca]|uniref:Uncharacterized protein n=1 Tax=Allacma fusca TaxID=39272 RepID=A0A8J2JQ70_9HEXA|nr:unnamed protein product [Allacma fusca]
MLSKPDVKFHFQVLNIFSILCLIPIKVNQATGTIARQDILWKQCVWVHFYAIQILHVLFLSWSLLRSVVFPDAYFVICQFPIHLCCSVSCILFLWYSTAQNVLEPGTTVMVFNDLYSKTEKLRRTSGLQEYSFQELLLILFPLLPVNLLLFTLFIYLWDPSQPIFITSYLRNTDLHPWTSRTFVCIEFLPWIAHMAGLEFQGFVYLSTLQMILARIDEESFTLQTEHPVTLDHIISAIEVTRQLHVLTRLFNLVFNYVTYFLKISCITVPVLFFWFTVQFSDEYPLISLMYFSLGLQTFVGFTSGTGNGFEIPMIFNEFKNSIMFAADRLEIKFWRQYTKRQLRATPCLGIEVGKFHTLQRATVPEFIQTIATTVANLLVAFQ